MDVCQHLVFPKTSLQRYSVRCFKFWDSRRLSHLSAIKAEPVIHHLISTRLFSISGPRKLQLFVQAAGVIEFAAEMAGSKISFSARMSVGEARADRRPPLSKLISPLAHPPIMFCARLSCTVCVFLAFALPQSLSLSAGHVMPARDRLDPPSLCLCPNPCPPIISASKGACQCGNSL